MRRQLVVPESQPESPEAEPTSPPKPTGPVTLALKHHIVVGTQTITELTFRPPRAKDLRGLKMNRDYAMDFILEFAGRISGQTRQVIDELTGEDLEEAIEIVNIFTPGSQRTGSEP
jgi:hypothetical protein